VQLGCGDGQQAQFVVLANGGPSRVSWQAGFSVPADQAGVQVSPDHGDLDAGTSTVVQVQNQTQSGGGQQGSILFTPDTPEAGPAPSLSYTTMGCG
jgi:hypothetical protein